MLTIKILNDATGPDHASNYTYTVDVNGKVIDQGTVGGHDRKKHWVALLQRIVAERIERARREFEKSRKKLKT
jgi:hypothetical protein